MSDPAQDIQAVSQRLNQGTHSQEDVQLMLKVFADRGGVAAGRDIKDSIIYAGVNIILTPEAMAVLRSAYRPPELPRAGMLPGRGYLPPGSRLPFPPNAVFTGREEMLHELAGQLLYSGAKGVSVTQEAAVAMGMGGIGKTQLAVEFCYQYGRFFYGVHWIQMPIGQEGSNVSQSIDAEIAACGGGDVHSKLA
jgi:hypothetical protein